MNNSGISNLTESIRLIGEKLRKFKSPFSEGNELLSKHGWYVSGNIKLIDLTQLIVLCSMGEIDEINERLSTFYKKNIKSMTNRIVEKHQNKKKIILEGVDAHKKGMYFSSTTLFLIQSDGICGTKLFVTNNGKKDKLKKHLLNTNDEDYVDRSLTPITTVSNIDVHSSKMKEGFSDLNRHEIIHGINTDFGCELNSLKAFSLLCFVSDFVDRHN